MLARRALTTRRALQRSQALEAKLSAISCKRLICYYTHCASPGEHITRADWLCQDAQARALDAAIVLALNNHSWHQT